MSNVLSWKQALKTNYEPRNYLYGVFKATGSQSLQNQWLQDGFYRMRLELRIHIMY
jgi:hypothetical protein